MGQLCGHQMSNTRQSGENPGFWSPLGSSVLASLMEQEGAAPALTPALPLIKVSVLLHGLYLGVQYRIVLQPSALML